jgi:hypothetical protein
MGLSISKLLSSLFGKREMRKCHLSGYSQEEWEKVAVKNRGYDVGIPMEGRLSGRANRGMV